MGGLFAQPYAGARGRRYESDHAQDAHAHAEGEWMFRRSAGRAVTRVTHAHRQGDQEQ